MFHLFLIKDEILLIDLFFNQFYNLLLFQRLSFQNALYFMINHYNKVEFLIKYFNLHIIVFIYLNQINKNPLFYY